MKKNRAGKNGEKVDDSRAVKLSVIVPVYNSKEYLEKCVDSIINQEYKDLEIILVDDGSTDGSGEICDRYKEDNKVCVIHQNNRGCMLSRLQGLQRSRGEYIGFVDSDDWIASDMYKTLMSVAEREQCDIVSMCYTAVREEKDDREEDGTLFGLYKEGRNLDILLSNMMYDAEKKRRGIHPALWSKVIRKELLQKAFTGIDGSIILGEDAAIFYPCCLNAKSVFAMKEYKYFYRIRKDSMCRDLTVDTFSQIHLFHQYMEKILAEYGTKYDLFKQLKKYVWTFLELGLRQIFKIRAGVAYVFPYPNVEKGSDVIVYGAGEVGQSYYDQIQENQYCNIVAWVDKNKNFRNNVEEVGRVLELNHAKIIIAIKSEDVAKEIINELSGLGVSEERMLWTKPQQLLSSI